MGDDGFLVEKGKKEKTNSDLKTENGHNSSEADLPDLKLGDVLKLEMKRKNLTISQLSKQCGISRTTIHNWIQGIGPSANNIPSLMKLCIYFEVSLEYLLFGVEISNSFSKGPPETSESIVYEGSFEDKGKSYSVVINRLDNKTNGEDKG